MTLVGGHISRKKDVQLASIGRIRTSWQWHSICWSVHAVAYIAARGRY